MWNTNPLWGSVCDPPSSSFGECGFTKQAQTWKSNWPCAPPADTPFHGFSFQNMVVESHVSQLILYSELQTHTSHCLPSILPWTSHKYLLTCTNLIGHSSKTPTSYPFLILVNLHPPSNQDRTLNSILPQLISLSPL